MSIDLFGPVTGSEPFFLVACGKEKQAGRHLAADLYTGDLFVKARAFAESQSGSQWRILSALHGVLHPAAIIADYNVSMANHNARAKAAWGNRCKMALTGLLKDHTGPVVVLAGRDYRDELIGNEHQRSYRWQFDANPWLNRVEVPMAGLGIGQQKAWLKGQLEKSSRCFEGVDIVDRHLARLSTLIIDDEARNCQTCGDSLPIGSTARRQYCSDRCRAASNEPFRPVRDQSERRAYNTAYQRERRRRMAAAKVAP